MIVHKLTEDLDSSDAECTGKIRALRDYLLRHPQTVIVDPLCAVELVVSRVRTIQTIQRLISSTPKCPFTQPRFAIASSPADIKQAMAASGLTYPVICKPIAACGTPGSHAMVCSV